MATHRSCNLPKILLSLIEEGAIALVLGAGASVGAEHPDGKSVPLAGELGKLISDKFLDSQYKDSSLSVIVELAATVSSLPRVQEFIRSVLNAYEPGPHHKLLTTFKWHGIATLNYDLIIERAYSGSSTQSLVPLYSDEDNVDELCTSPTHLKYLKLHGCITRTNDESLPLILTPEQYLRANSNRRNLFKILEDWARDRTLVFVGTSLNDSDIRGLLLQLSSNPQWRSRHYLVQPHSDELMRRLWETKKIEVISSDFETFVYAIDSAITATARAIAVPDPDLPVFKAFNQTNPVVASSTRHALENDLEWVHASMAVEAVSPADFYKGAGKGWGAIKQGLDVRRHIEDRVLLENVIDKTEKDSFQLIAIKAPAGAGKSVLLHRLAWTAAIDLDALCLFAKNNSVPSPDVIEDVVGAARRRVFLFIDNAAYDPDKLERLCDRLERRRIAVSIVVTCRNNEWNVSCNAIEPFVVKEYELRYLNPEEIDGLLDLLSQHGCLGTLEGASRQDQRDAFVHSAGRQLLVALHEATLGRPFEDIVFDEYSKLVPSQAQSIYLTVCALNRMDVPVRAGLVSRVHGVSFDEFKEKFLAPLEHVVFAKAGRHGMDIEYHARHPHIAEFVFRRALPTAASRFDRIMQVVSGMNTSYEADARAFEKLVNAKVAKELLSEYELIEEFYRLAKEVAPRDGHVYLQHGLCEMNRAGGDLQLAEQEVAQAHELLPHNPIIRHVFAELEVRRAEREPNDLLFESHIKKAIELAEELAGRFAKSAHGFTTIVKAERTRLARLLNREQGEVAAEAVAKIVERVESSIDTATQRFGDDEHLLKEEAVFRELLSQNHLAVEALERAVGVSVRNVSVVVRLARIYQDKGEVGKAKELLERAIECAPTEMRLHALLSKLLIRMEEAPILIESHLRRSFVDGDDNCEMLFYYARQLYIVGKLDESRSQFEKLAAKRLSQRQRFEIRLRWMEAGQPKRFSGKVSRLASDFGFVDRDGPGDRVFLQRNSQTEYLWQGGPASTRVTFSIAFNAEGPIAVDVRSERGY